MKYNRIDLLSLIFLLCPLFLLADPPQIFRLNNPDQVQVIREGSSLNAEQGMDLQEADELVTGPTGRALIRLPNSDTIQVGVDSRLQISRFFHDPDTGQIQARVELGEGELIGDLQTISQTPDSQFQIATLVGVAGIRGTQFRIFIRRNNNTRQLTARFSVASGNIDVEFTGLAADVAATVLTEVGAEEEVEVTGNIDPQTGEITNIEAVSEQPISQDSRNAISQAVQELQEASDQEDTTDQEDTDSEDTDEDQGQQDRQPIIVPDPDSDFVTPDINNPSPDNGN